MTMSTARGDRSDPSLASLMRDEEASRFGDEANGRRREAREKWDSRQNTRSTFFRAASGLWLSAPFSVTFPFPLPYLSNFTHDEPEHDEHKHH